MTSTTVAAPTIVSPHGGTLINRKVASDQHESFSERAESLASVRLDPRQASDLEMIAIGAFSPLQGFMTRADYEEVVSSMHLVSGEAWSMPVTLSVDSETANGIPDGAEVALRNEDGKLIGSMIVEEKYTYDKEKEAGLVYRTTDEAHPGVANLYAQGPVLLGGPVRYLQPPRQLAPFHEYRFEPEETRRRFVELGWKTVVGFQTRNPVHRAHEYLQKCAMEIVDGLLLHPLVGATKDDDIPADVRMRCYVAILENYYPKDRVLLSVNPAFMRYAGPREAIFHALVRKNYGCSHFIVGRDHAGVGSYYGTYDAQHIFSEFKDGELGIQPLFFENSFYCTECGGMGTSKTCPHSDDSHIFLSGTQVRAMLSRGELPPEEFTRPEVASILAEAYRDS